MNRTHSILWIGGMISSSLFAPQAKAVGPAVSGAALTFTAAACLQTEGRSEPRRVRHEYDLNQEKSEAVFQLLAPEEVKVLVGRRDGGVFIEGTPKEAKVLSDFVELLTRHEGREVSDTQAFVEELRASWNSKKTYELEAKKADLLFRVLAIDDVGVLVTRHGPEKIVVEASKPDQKTVGRVVRILEGERLGGADTDRRRRRERRETPRRENDQKSLEQDLYRFFEMFKEKRDELAEHVEELEEKAKWLGAAVKRMGEEIERETDRLADGVKRYVGPGKGPRPPRDVHRGEPVVRQYELPPHHARNLYDLLAPEDIKDVIITRRNGVLEVRARPHDHETIERLVELLTRNDS